MSEETRRLRAQAIATAETAIASLRDKITTIEHEIDNITNGIPPELSEDYAWRLSQMPPSERMLHELTVRMFRESERRFVEERERSRTDALFTQGQQRSTAPLRINLPKDFTVVMNPKDPT